MDHTAFHPDGGGGGCTPRRNFSLSQSSLWPSAAELPGPDSTCPPRARTTPSLTTWKSEQSRPVPSPRCKEGTLLGIYYFHYFTVNLHALVCSETNEPPDPAALTSRWGSLGRLAAPSTLLGGGTSALEYSTGHHGAGTKQTHAHADRWRQLAPAP